MELAGLVLGGIPIAVLALQHVAEPLDTFCHYRTWIETLIADLRIQDCQLRTTLSNVGLHGDSSREETRRFLKTKYPDIAPHVLLVIEEMEDAIARLLKGLDVDESGKIGAQFDKPKMRWRRVKDSFSVKKQKQVIEDLRRRNEDLRLALDPRELPAEDDSRDVLELKNRFSDKRCSALRNCLHSLHRALQSACYCGCSPPHQVAIDLNWKAYDSGPDVGKKFQVAVSYDESADLLKSSTSWRKLHVRPETPSQRTAHPPALLAPPTPSSRPTSPTSPLRSKFVCFSTRSPPATPPPAQSPTVSREPNSTSTATLTEISCLCDTVCGRLSPCALTGTLRDPECDLRQEFALSCNHEARGKILSSRSMRSLLQVADSLDPGGPRPPAPHESLSVKQRLGIAAALAWSVLHLSGSPWLLDNWADSQAGMFVEADLGGRELLSRYPHMSYTFSTPESPPAQEPPLSDFDHLIPNRTVFALGVLLIELGSRRPVPRGSGSLLDEYQAAMRSLDEVYSSVGDSYGYAAERCVKFSFQGRTTYKNFDHELFRQQFYAAVVAPVQATYSRFPSSYVPAY